MAGTSGEGSIECSSLDAAVQFSTRDLQSLQQGLEPRLDCLVAFTLQVAPDGTYEAKALQLIEDGGKGKGKGASALASPTAQFGPAGEAVDGQRLQGQVVSYNQTKGWGFLRCASVQGDCFFKGDGQQIA